MRDKINQSTDFIVQRKEQKARHLIPVTIFGLTIVSFAVIVMFDYLKVKEEHIYSYDNLIMSIEISTANSHLSFDEFLLGDTTVDVDKNLAGIDQAEKLIGGLLKDGITWRGIKLQPIENKELIAQIEVVDSDLREYKSVAEESLAHPELGGIGSALKQNFENIYKRLSGELRRVEGVFDAETTAIQKESQNVFWATLIIWATIISWSIGNIIKLESFRSRAEESLRASLEHRYTNILDNSGEAIVSVDERQRIIVFNKGAENVFGYDADEVMGKPLEILLPLDLVGAHSEQFDNFTASGDTARPMSERAPVSGRKKDGSLFPAEASISKVNIAGEPVVTVIMRDITKRKKAEGEVAFQASMLEQVHNGVVAVDINNKIIYWNRYAEELFQWKKEEVIGKDIVDLLSPEELKSTAMVNIDATRREGHWEGEFDVKRKDGSTIPTFIINTLLKDLNGNNIGILGISADITERKKNQEERERLIQNLERAHRMESLGMLAGGVAHDLNNIIGPILAFPDLILMDLPPDTSVKSDVLAIKTAAERAADIIADLLALARRGKYEMSPLNLNGVVNLYLKSPEFKEAQSRSLNVMNRHELALGLYNINSSTSHLYKVVLNLVINAFDSMKDGGVLTIRTFNERVDAKIVAYEEIPVGLYVVLEVEDQGRGIGEEQLGLIFEPFFSTKKKVGRQGSGLGLSVVHGIVKDHKGFIDVRSRVGEGTKIRLYFPATEEQETITPEKKNDYSGSETILAVDDNKSHLKIVDKLLSSLGYKVVTAKNGRKAVDYLKKKKVDLVILDMIMEKDFSGLDTYREILKLNPNQKAIIISGYAETEQVRDTLMLGAGIYIKKPYNLDTIGKAIREELDKADK